MNIEYIEGIVANGVPIPFYRKIKITLKNGDCIHCKCWGCVGVELEVFVSETNKHKDLIKINFNAIQKIEML